MQHRFEEYFVKVILENIYANKFGGFAVKDKPDLWSDNGIGVEVTNCMPEEVARAANVWHEIYKNGAINQDRNIEHLRKMKIDYRKPFCWDQGWYSPNLDESPIRYFLKAVGDKVDKLNSPTAQYVPMESYELFVNSFILIPMRQMREVVERLKITNSKPKKFDIIYLLTNEQKLLMFDMKNDSLREMPLYGWLEGWAEMAKQICREKKANDET